ncbi:VOC family protein [Rhodococcoides yunnanense]|uniref:VOC family protein n=1 Tax=Rhodococcoides yunnanense TaxID=278209 RepID=UPI0009353C44|nr:VOC family protein [Rhodococcus yunnanensis]
MSDNTGAASTAITLGQRILRLSHVVINVSDAEKSLEFYETFTPLRAVGKLNAPRQRFGSLGIESGEFEGYVLNDGTAGRPTSVHIVEWKTPEPVGSPYPVFWHVGLGKLGFGTKVPPEERLAHLREHGVETTNKEIVRGYISILDPDGTVVSFYQDGDKSARHDHWVHVNAVVTDRERGAGFFRDVLGLEQHLDVTTDRPIAVSQGPGSDLSQWSSHLFAPRGDTRVSVDMTQPVFPAPSPETSTPYQEANNLGISRVGFEVDDLDAAYSLLQASAEIGAAPGIVDPPETWDFGPEFGTRRVLGFRDPDGIRIEFFEKPPRPESSFLHFSPPED